MWRVMGVLAVVLVWGGWATAEEPVFTSNVTGLNISFPTGHFVEKGSVINVVVEIAGEQPQLEEGGKGTVALETYEMTGKRLTAITVEMPQGGAMEPPGVAVAAPAKPGGYIIRALIRVHTKQGLYADMVSKNLPFYVFQRPKVLASTTVELDAKGGTVALDKQPKAPSLVFTRGALTGPCSVTLELLDGLPIPPANPAVKLWGKPVNLRIEGAEIAEDAHILLPSPIGPTDKQAVLAGYLFNGAWLVNLVELNNGHYEAEAPGLGASLPEMEVKDLLVFGVFTIPKPK